MNTNSAKGIKPMMANADFTIDILCPEVRVGAINTDPSITHFWTVYVLDNLVATGTSASFMIPYNGTFEVTHMITYSNSTTETETKSLVIDCIAYQSCTSNCKNLISNPNLLLVNPLPPNPDLWESFYNYLVPGWLPSRYTPHHVDVMKKIENGQIEYVCVEGTAFNCLAATTMWSEGIFTNINFVNDEELTYCISLETNQLSCATGFGEVQLRACNGLVRNNLSPFSDGLDGDYEVIYNGASNGGHPIISYRPSRDFTQFEIIHHNGLNSFIALQDINVSCSTSALKDISVTQNSTCSYSFSPEATKQFCTYSWVINGKDTVGMAEQLDYQFTTSGVYNVCLKVEDCNGCCAQHCDTITINIPPIVKTIFSDVLCSSNGAGSFNNLATFSTPNLGPNYSFMWSFGDGSTSTLPNPSHSYASMGTYTVSVTISDLCGVTETVSKVITVLCNPPGEISCGKNVFRDGYYIDGRINPVLFSEYAQQNNIPFSTYFFSKIYSNQKIIVSGSLVIDESVSFVNCEFLFDDGSDLTLRGIHKWSNQDIIGCTLKSCGGVMWKGIKSELGNHFIGNGTTIMDAEFGVEVGNYGYIAIKNANFYNNCIGLYFVSNPTHEIHGNKFGDAQFNSNKAAYPGQLRYYNKPYAGVIFDNAGQGTVGGNLTSQRNYFSYLSVAVAAFRTNITCINNSITNLINFSSFPSIDIFTSSLAAVYIEEGYNQLIEKNDIVGTGFRYAIHISKVRGGKIEITKNNIQNFVRGIDLKDNFNAKIIISKHKGEFFAQGQIKATTAVYCPINNSNCTLDINTNTFNSQDLFQRSAIYIAAGNDNLPKKIFNNTFEISFVVNPTPNLPRISIIDAIGCQKLEIGLNRINSYTTIFHQQLRLQDCKAMVENNIFKDLSPNNSVLNSMLLTNVSGSSFYCNQVIGGQNGFNFNLPNNKNIDFATNLMENNTIGLLVNKDITPQYNKGNLWAGQLTKATLLGGGFGNGSNFFVNPNQSTPFVSNNTSFKPDVVSPSIWFRDIGLNASSCFYEVEDPNVTNEDGNQKEVLELATFLTDTENEHPLDVWRNEARLFQLITEHTGLLTLDAQITMAYNNIPTAVIDYINIENSLKSITKLTPQEEASLTSINGQIQWLHAQRDSIWSTFDINSSQDTSLINQADLLYTQLASAYNDQQLIMTSIKARQGSEFTGIKTLIGNLPTPQYFNVETKEVLTALADLYLYGSDYVKSNHHAALSNIAALCYRDYGWSVPVAGAVMESYGSEANTSSDDCSNVQQRSATHHTAQYQADLYPNPSSNKIYLSHLENIASIEIHDLTGRVLLKVDDCRYGIDVSGLPNGIHIVEIMYNDNHKSSQRLIKID